MKAEDLYEAITDLPDGQVTEGEKKLSRAGGARFRWAGLAAVLAVVVLTGVLVLPKRSGIMGGGIEPGGSPPSGAVISTEAKPSDAEAPTEDPNAPDDLRYTLAAPNYPLMNTYGRRAEVDGLEACLRTALPVLLEGAERENRVCAPLNIYSALAMLAETTAGDSRQELLKLLNAPDLETLRAQSKALWESNYCNDENLSSLLAASLWLRDDIAYNDETVQVLADDYYASTFSGTMGDPEYTNALRRWMNEQTKGLLADQIDEIELSDDTAVALVTTVYYRAGWTQQFHMTVPGVFHGLGGDRELNFLTQTLINKTLYTGDGFLATGLSLSGGQGTAWFLLPDENLTPADLLSNQRTLDFLISDKGRGNTDGCQVDLTLSVPKFDVSDKTDLIEKLKKLGVISIFDRCRSDFTPLTTDLQEPITVSKAEHGARVSADENGLTGAAYTIIEPTNSGIPEPLEKFELTLDRPFLFVVANEEGLPIFVGIVNQPTP